MVRQYHHERGVGETSRIDGTLTGGQRVVRFGWGRIGDFEVQQVTQIRI